METTELKRGTRVMNLYGHTGIITKYVPGTRPAQSLGGVIFSGGGHADIVYETLSFSSRVPEGIIKSPPWRIIGQATEKETTSLELQAKIHQNVLREKREREEKENRAIEEKGKEIFERKRPAWAKAVIVAYKEIDDCDLTTDYFNTKSGEMYILAWSRHTRDIFSELRKAASRMKETEHLATAPGVNSNGERKTEANKSWWHPADEHREKYSMGAGYYLKAGNRYSTGWNVEKIPLHDYCMSQIYYASGCGRLLA